MEQLFTLCDRFAGSSVSAPWRSLLELYAVIERETAAFQAHFNVHCPEGCGTCCEHFIPDPSELEASLIAAYLLYVKQDDSLIDRLVNFDDASKTCPLYSSVSPFHCTIYPVRGLICRLFGACPSEDKGGHPVFRPCKYNSDHSASFLGAERFSDAKEQVPTMQRYAVQFNALSTNGTTRTLAEAVLREMNRLRFIGACLSSGSHDDDNGGSDPLMPTPQAS